MKIARVFPTMTSMTPTDQDAWYDAPDMLTPQYDEVHISCVFTWDIPKAQHLAKCWQGYGRVRVGGPAYDDNGSEFIAGKFLRHGITITSRGCPNKCSFCLIPKREGNIRELPIVGGNIIQDNNFLACSQSHIEKVFEMLKTKSQIEFKGGLEARRITTRIADQLRGLRIKTLWLACDSKGALQGFQKAVQTLHKAGFKAHHIACYVLIGDDITENEARLREVYATGCYPFAQLFQPADHRIEYSREWKRFARTWSRPAAYKFLMKPRSVIRYEAIRDT